MQIIDVNAYNTTNKGGNYSYLTSNDNYWYLKIVTGGTTSSIRFRFKGESSRNTYSSFLGSASKVSIELDSSGSTNNHQVQLVDTSITTQYNRASGKTGGAYDVLEFRVSYVLPAHYYIKDYSIDCSDTLWCDAAEYNNGTITSNTAMSTGTHSSSARRVTTYITLSAQTVGLVTWHNDVSGQTSTSYRKYKYSNCSITLNGTRTNRTVTFTNGLGTTLKTQTVADGSGATAPSNPARTGYTFNGWDKSFSSVCGGNITVNATWKINSYTLTYNANGGSVSPSSKSLTYGSQYGTLPTPTRTGYSFNGWYTASSGGSKVSTTNTIGAGNVTIYAQWSINSYTLTYNANGGSVSPSSKSLTYGSQYGTLPTPTRTGYSFNGWYTASSGGSKVSTTNTIGAGNVTIYAQWTLNSYSLTINPNGGVYNGSTQIQTVTQGYNTSYNLSQPTRVGYTFSKWMLNGPGSFGPTYTYNNAGNGQVILTNQGKSSDNPTDTSNEIKIQVNGTASPGYGGFYTQKTSEANKTYIHSFSAKLPLGYKLAIAHNAVGSGSSEYWITSNVGTGKWENYSYLIKSGTSGSFSTFGHVYVQATGVTVPFTWYISDTQISTNGITPIIFGAGNSTVKAQWTANNYTVTYDGNGGTWNNQTTWSNLATYNSNYVTEENFYTRPGYVFIGWNEKPDGTGTSWTDWIGKPWKWSYTKDVTLYAQWASITTVDAPILTHPDQNEILPFISDGKLVIQQHDQFTPLNYVEAIDTKDGNVTDNVTVKSMTIPLNDNKADVSGEFEVIFTVTNSDKIVTDKEMIVIVNESPKLSVIDRYFFKNQSDVDVSNLLNKMSGTDKEDGNITDYIKVKSIDYGNGNVDTNVSILDTSQEAEYTIVYSLTDKYKKTVEEKAILHVVNDVNIENKTYKKSMRLININYVNDLNEKSIWRTDESYKDILTQSLDNENPIQTINLPSDELDKAKEFSIHNVPSTYSNESFISEYISSGS